MSKPATVPTHDTNGTLLTTPPSGILSDGYEPLDKPAAGWFNWLFYWITQWIAWLQTASPVFATTEAAYAALTGGDFGIVYENDKNYRLGIDTVGTAGGTAATDVSAICCNGTHVFYAHGAANPVMVARAALNTTVRTFTRTNAGTVARLLTNGTFLFAAYGTYVEAWTISTGASAWVYNHGATVYDIAIHSSRLCLVGASGTGTKHARGLLQSTGGVQWSYAHGSAVPSLYSVTAIPGAFVVAGDASTFASAANMRALAFLTGNDAANEGGTAADTTGVAWDKVQANTSLACALAGDRGGLWWINDTGNSVNILDRTTGSVLTSYTIAADLNQIVVDQDNVYVAADGADRAWCLDKHTLRPKWSYVAGDDVMCVATDGAAVFIGLGSTPATFGVWRLPRGNRPHPFRRPILGAGNTDEYALNSMDIMPDGD